MDFFDWDYFSGANVTIELNGILLTEAAGVSYGISESKRPIYGYSSRHFDGVASGQVLVQGQIIINFVHARYLYELIRNSRFGDLTAIAAKAEADSAMLIATDPNQLREIIKNQPFEEVGLGNALKDAYWGGGSLPINSAVSLSNAKYAFGSNPHDPRTSVNIKITYGEKAPYNSFNGQTNRMLLDVFFRGQSQTIQIDENTIVEVYDFFARDITDVMLTTQTIEVPNNEGGNTDESVNDLEDTTKIVTAPAEEERWEDIVDTAISAQTKIDISQNGFTLKPPSEGYLVDWGGFVGRDARFEGYTNDYLKGRTSAYPRSLFLPPDLSDPYRSSPTR